MATLQFDSHQSENNDAVERSNMKISMISWSMSRGRRFVYTTYDAQNTGECLRRKVRNQKHRETQTFWRRLLPVGLWTLTMRNGKLR